MTKNQGAPIVSLKCGIAAAFFGSAALLSLPQPTSAAETFPWCVQGETLQCYYATRAQCELTVNFRGFCVANPDAPAQTGAPRRQRGSAR